MSTQMEDTPADTQPDHALPGENASIDAQSCAAVSPATVPALTEDSSRGPAPPTFPSYQTLPHEALLLIFHFLNDLHNKHLHSCTLVCKSWRKLIINEPAFWDRLYLDLDYPEMAAEKAKRHAHRSFQKVHFSKSTPAGQAFVPSDTGQPSLLSPQTATVPKSFLDLSLSYLDLGEKPSIDKVNRGHLPPRLEAAVPFIVKTIQPHLSALRIFSIHLVGREPFHLRMLYAMLLPQLMRDPTKGFSRTCNSRYFQLSLPHMRGLPLSANVLAYFEGAETVNIRGNQPFPDYVRIPPQEPEVPQIARKILAYRRANHPMPPMTTQEIASYKSYERAMRQYEAEMAEHDAYWDLEELDWDTFHHPSARYLSTAHPGQPINVHNSCNFHTLTNLTLFGCVISDNMVLPKDGFPNMTNLSITRSNWGHGLWTFLAATPNLECLRIQDLSWNNPISNDTESSRGSEEGGEDNNSRFPGSPTPTLAYAEVATTETLEGLAGGSQASSDLSGDQTPPYPAQSRCSPTAKHSKLENILQNSYVTILGDDENALFDFDEDPEDEDSDMIYGEIIDDISSWRRDDPAYKYPETLCYPPDIDTGVAWTVITKPIHKHSWRRKARFNFVHRVYTHYDDQPNHEDDFMSEFLWPELQRRRAAVRRAQDARNAKDASNFAQNVQQSPKVPPEHAPGHIDLLRLHSLSFNGGSYPPIWASTKSHDGDLIQHPALNMPSLTRLSLCRDTSLDSTRLARPLAEVHKNALSYSDKPERRANGPQGPARITGDQFEEIVHAFEEGKVALPGEPNDRQVIQMMSSKDADWFTVHAGDIERYRHDWRVHHELLSKDGVADERALLAMITGADRMNLNPFAATALVATCLRLSQLDLSYTNISSDVFRSLLQYLGGLRELSLAGVSTLRDADLQPLPYNCPALVSLDLSRCAPSLTARGAVYVVDGIRQNPYAPSRLRKIKVDEPQLALSQTRPPAIIRQQISCYQYLAFLDVIVDEELELWLSSRQTGAAFSKRPGKQRQV